MDVQKYIASGILELYVAGVLSEKENESVATAIETYPEIENEVLRIEHSIVALTAAVADEKSTPELESFANKNDVRTITPLEAKRRTAGIHWIAYVGWAASIALLFGLWTMFNHNKDLSYEISAQEAKNAVLESQITSVREELRLKAALVTIFRDKNIEVVNLDGQQVAPDTYAKAFWNTKDDTLYIDAIGLPTPPEGKVYQVWSLTLNPLTPTSIGLLQNFEMEDNRIFSLSNANASEAFGITLEPAGGSEIPTMEQLYTLGVVKS